MIKLLLLVKNEAHTLERTLCSVAPLVDSFTAYDSDSTDGTPDLLRAWSDRFGIPGTVHNGSFVDYSQARNACWALARESDLAEDWHLWIDADDVYRGDAEFLRVQLKQTPFDAFDLLQKWRGVETFAPRLFRASIPWQYTGRVHELVYAPGPYRRASLAQHAYEHVPSALGARRTQQRWKRDLDWLAQDHAEATNDFARKRIEQYMRDTRRCLRTFKEQSKSAPS